MPSLVGGKAILSPLKFYKGKNFNVKQSNYPLKSIQSWGSKKECLMNFFCINELWIFILFIII
jgi:hypothetical protein